MMRRPSLDLRWLAVLALIVCVGAGVPLLGGGQRKPRLDDPSVIGQGKSLYRGRCAACHGMDARGYRANDLTAGEWENAPNDDALALIITRGIPGTEMTGTSLHDDEVWMIVAYLNTLKGTTRAETRGNAGNGERFYWASDKGNCAQCHLVNGRGGRLGPDLSRIGAARSRAALTREIRRASAYQPSGYEAVTVVTRDGRRLRGCRKNEDTFSIQLMTVDEKVLTFLKSDLAEVVDEPHSLMPDYGQERLTDADLDDLLAYLGTLRGRPVAAAR